MARRQHREEAEIAINMTAMIDVVFQLLIFFICSSDYESAEMGGAIFLPEAPHGQETTKRDPRTIYIDVDSHGYIIIGGTSLSAEKLTVILKKVIVEQGGAKNVPVVIRGDKDVKHEVIKSVMDACSLAGLHRLRFAAQKEKGKGGM